MPSVAQIAIAILNFLEPFFERHGYAFVFLGGFFENTLFLGWLLPGGTVVSLGGFYARYVDPIIIPGQTRHLSLFWVIILSIIGATLGKVMDYWIGHFIGKKIIKTFNLARQEEMAKHFITKHGAKAFFLTSVTGPLRSILMLTAGIIRTPFEWFFGIIFLTSIIWGTVFAILGYFLGQNRALLEKIISYFGVFGWVIIIGFVVWKIIEKKKGKEVEVEDKVLEEIDNKR